METVSTILAQLEIKLESITKSTKKESVFILPPAKIETIELNQGKITFQSYDDFSDYDWNRVKNETDLIHLHDMISQASIIALVDWAHLANAEDIWDGLLHDIIKASGRNDFRFFFDLGDPSKKSAYEIDNMLDLISDFSYYGSVTLILRAKEAQAIWSELNGSTRAASPEEAGRFIHYNMNIDHLVVHGADRVLLFTRKALIELPVNPMPINKSNFESNGRQLEAGLLFGQLAGFTMTESIVLGMATEACYLEEGKIPDIDRLLRRVIKWKDQLKERPEQGDQMNRSLFTMSALQ